MKKAEEEEENLVARICQLNPEFILPSLSPGSCTHETTLTNSLTKPGTMQRKIAVQPREAGRISTSTL